ncbi:MAG: nuclear transport factor 2 family protein [Roseiarcus sp.]
MDAVKAAVAAYNQAVDSLDAAKMEALWLQDDTVVDIESRSKSIGLGWEAVKKNLEQNFSPFAELKDAQVDGPHVQIKGNVALSTAWWRPPSN